MRRSRALISGDQPFVAMQSSNISMETEVWRRLGHPVAFDVVTGWRLWNEGVFFIPDSDAMVSAGWSGPPPTGDPRLLGDVVPHRRFRSGPSSFHSTPKVSWVVAVPDAATADARWKTCSAATFADHEILFHGPSEAVAAWVGMAAVNPRVTVVPTEGGADGFGDAVAAARGELVAILDPKARLAPETLTKAVARYEENAGVGVVRFGYRVAGERYLRLDDLSALDSTLGSAGLPLFAVASRRELMKESALREDPGASWGSVLARHRPALIIAPLVELDGPAPIAPHSPGVSEISAVGVREMARTVVREARRRHTHLPTDQDVPAEDDERVSVAYVGFTGHDNLGDEAVMTAIQRLMPWARLEAEPVDPQLLMVGGGTLINGRRYYLTRLLRQESPTVERALFGTGVRSPNYWGVTEPMEDWFSFIDSALVAAVRGPDSVRNLRKLGYHRDLPILGDPALSLRPPPVTEPVEGRVVMCPVYTEGNLHGGSDEVVFDGLAVLIGKLRAEGREVVLMSAFPRDDRWIIDLMRRAGAHDLPYVAGYADIDATMALLASADLVVGERLHAAIMAVAAGTAFVGLEYRPKVRDFARSVGQERAVIRTDEMERLVEVSGDILARADLVVAETAPYVEDYRNRQEEAAAELRRRLTGE